MECLNIDFVGPFPNKGYILSIIDTFSRWIELFCTLDATAASTANCLLQHFGRFGTPAQLRSDRGPHFIADVIKEFTELVGTLYRLRLSDVESMSQRIRWRGTQNLACKICSLV